MAKGFPKKIKIAIAVLLSLVAVSASALTVRLLYLRSLGGGDTVVVPDNLIGEVGDSTVSGGGTTLPGGTTTTPDGTAAVPGETTTSPNGTSTAPEIPSAPSIGTEGDRTEATAIELYRGHPADNQKFQVHNLFPGDRETRYFAVRIHHSADVTVYFDAEVTEQTKALAQVLQIKVIHLDTGKLLYDGTFADLDPDGYAELFAAPADGKTVAYYEIQVSLPTSVGNAHQQARLTADFSWFVREQEALDPPQTGDDAPLWLWIALAAVSALGVVLLVLLRPRKKEGSHEE